MGRKDFFALLLCAALIHSTIAYPRTPQLAQSSEEDDDTQQQQQQNIDSDSLEELTQKIQAKGKRPQKLQVTELEPEPEPYDPCLDGKKVGPCKGRVPRFFFNQATGSCERFSWGGCSKTGNNFKELTECETSCSKHLTTAKLDVEQDQQATVVATCEKPPVRQGGPECEAYIPRWTFNSTQHQCVQFIWGGCGKTENNFATENSCKATCGEYSNLKNNNGPTTTTPRSRDLQQQQNADVVGPEPPKSKDICDLPSEPGLCLALFERYYFNKINNRCELFTYGGCGGNENRFDTAEDCVRACGGDTPVNDPQCADVVCPWALYDHYYSLGCSPIYDGEACCPTRYECPDNQQELQNNTLDSRSLTLERENEDGTTVGPETTMPQKCRYRGKYYNVGEQVNEASDTGSCRAGCICVNSEPEPPRIVCAQIECAEHFSGRPPGKEKCIPLYKKDSCCAHDYHCPEGPVTVVDPNQQETDKVLPLAKCMVDGEGYYEGQRVYPNKSPCSKCLCQRNPSNITSPEGQLYCEKIDCGVEIYYSHYLARGCAPVYYEKGDGTTSCCPISWECPDEQHGGQDDHEDDVATTPGTSVPGPQPPQPPSTDGPTTTTVAPTTIKPNSPLTRSHEACTMPKAEGSCKGHRPRFYYNVETEKCESFVYTGCRGNFNNFASIEDCRDLCEPGAEATSTPAAPPAKGGKSGGLLGRNGVPPPPTPPRQTKAISCRLLLFNCILD
ncbi:unnamed protein product [Orchesella dallaii]|uniref:Papilin n=1 Tax=Orchesella dallaii TaxID=48710 RepID=A0ABP1QR43_9HEXA